MNNIKRYNGFTLIEVLVVIGIIAILATVVLVAVNPARQFKIARDSQRTANVAAILNAIGQNMTDNSGLFTCEETTFELPSTKTQIKSTGGVDIGSCLVPVYIASLPFDPAKPGAHYTSGNDYDTGYFVSKDVYGRVSVIADAEMSSTSISVTR